MTASGYSLVELLFTLAVIATLSAIAVPQLLATLDRTRAASAARFEDHPSGITFRMFLDGNRNGVRTADIAAALDVPLEAPVRLSNLYPGTAIAVSGAAGSDPVHLGSSDLLSFTPLGTSTSGSVFVRGRDGSQFAIRVLGATGRTRVQRYVLRTHAWVDGF